MGKAFFIGEILLHKCLKQAIIRAFELFIVVSERKVDDICHLHYYYSEIKLFHLPQLAVQ